MWEAIQEIASEFVENTGLTIVRAIAFFVLGLIVVKIVRLILRSVLFKSKLDGAATTFVVSIVTIILYIAVVILLIASLGFSTAGIIAACSAVALAVILALKDSLSSLANGIIIIFTKPFKKGDYVKIGDQDGLVQDIRLFNTKILTYSNEEIIIPNSDVLTTDVINYSTMPLRRISFSLPVPYSVNVTEVKTILLESLIAYKHTLKMPAPSVVLEEFGDSALKFSVRAWVLNENYWDAYYGLREELFNALGVRGITIPFNRLEVRLMPPSSDASVPAIGAPVGKEVEK